MADTAARLEAPGATLTDRDREVLAFERHWWKYAGAKEQAIKELFDMSATRYYQVLNGLLDNPAALAADPMLVKRLRRMRTERQRVRSSARRVGQASASAHAALENQRSQAAFRRARCTSESPKDRARPSRWRLITSRPTPRG